ncbi:MAG: TlpA family protein disulfide reductase [Verrucomicrobia bacterium]|nr:TlpA family protein disulfide reductase [Verrucomicrobiota bacterium]
MKSFRSLRQVLPVTLMLGLASCAKQAEPAKSAAAQPAKPAAGAMAALPKLGAAPAWNLKDVDGKAVSSAQFAGKVLVVDFWATWCGPCRQEIPGYIELQKKYGADKLAVVGVSLDQAGPEVVKAFIAKNGVNYQMVMGDDAVIGAFGGVEAIPTTFLIDKAGQIRDRKVGAEEAASYERKIAALME